MTTTVDAIADRELTTRGRLVDAGTAVALLVTTAVTVPLTADSLGVPIPDAPVVVTWAVALTAPLAFRRSAPAVVATVVVLVFIAGQALSIPEALVSQIAPFLALYTLGAWSPRRARAIIVLATLSALLVLWFLLAVSLSRMDPEATPSAVALSALSTGLYLAAASAFGEAGWRSFVRRTALQRRTDELQQERELTARQAVDLERSRIARELHDVLAHHVSLMGIEAGAARRVLSARPGDTAPAVDALVRIEESSRRAVDELGRTVNTLRDADPMEDGPSHAPSTVGIAQIEDLIRDTRDAGRETEYALYGDPAVVPAASALALHRIVQESLTNVRKHAGDGVRTSVELRIGGDTIELTVTNSRGATATSVPGTGTGQIGMRERAVAAGGRIEMGPIDDGYRVHAVLPVQR